jgi:outer membrane receptor protein involved in Fe transport
MTKVAKALLVLLFGLLLTAIPVFGQAEAGSISGTIRDASGAVVSGAKVTAKSVNTGLTRDVVTNSDGLYAIPSLKADTYEVTIEAKGFQKYASRTEVTVGSQNDVSASLSVGGSATTIEVSGAVEVVAPDTESQTLSQIVTSSDIDRLPTSPTRNPYALVGMAAGVTEDTMSDRGAGYSINGQRSASTNILLDGAENVDTFTATVGQQIPLDSVQEFSVLTSNYGAEFGRASGGVVNLITKSGSNQFHGSAYEFNRVSDLSSNTYNDDANDIPKGVFTRNNFGFSFGGPIKKDKLFFFNNTEWIRVRSAAPTFFTIIDPGSYPLLASASQQFFSTYGKLAPGLVTTGTESCGYGSLVCDSVSTAVPSDAGGGNPQNTWMEVAKVDFNLSNKTTISGRYAGYHELDFPGVVNSSPYAGFSTGQFQFDQNYTFSVNHVFSSSLVESARLVYNRLNGPVQGLGANPVAPTLYTAGSIPEVGGFSLVFPGYSEETPGNSIPFGGPQNLYEIYDDVSWSKGQHQFKLGVQFIQLRDNRVFGAYENAVEILGTNLTTGLQNLSTGNIYQFEGAINPQGEFPCYRDPTTGAYIQTPACTLTLPVGPPAFNRNYRYNDIAAYGQDSWRIAPHFTLNLGLRWEYYGVQHNGPNSNLDSNFVLGSGGDIFDQIRNGSVQLARNGGVFWKPFYGGFGPRLGFAWDVFGDGKTSLRGGYATSFERNFGNVTFNTIQNPPAYAVVSLISGQDVPSQPVYTANAGPLAGSGVTKLFPAVSQRAINQNLKESYAETYDLSLERRVTRNSLLSINYSGSHGVHLYDISNINLAGDGGAYLGDGTINGYNPGNRLNLQYSNMNYRSDNGFNKYNGGSVQWRASNFLNKGLNINTSYTWSHALDNLSSTFSDGAASDYGLGYLDAFNPRLAYGNSDYDIRQRFVLNGSWELPWLKNGKSVASEVLGGWLIGGTFSARSGAPFSIYDCDNFNGTECPLWVPSAAVARTGHATAAGSDFAPNTFNYITLPNTGGVVDNLGDSLGIPNCTGLGHVGCTYTISGRPYPTRNGFFGPGYWNSDMNFLKSFTITERFRLQFRAEMYNIFNHHNQYINIVDLDTSFLSPSATTGNPTPYIQTEKGGIFGTAGLTGASATGQPADERRNIQFGLRLSF